jgi:membrane protein
LIKRLFMEGFKAAGTADELGRLWRFVNFQLRIWPQCARLLVKNRATQVAAALSYQTIFGIVPLAIVILMVFAWINSFSNLSFSVKNLLLEQAFFNAQYPTENPEVHITLADKIDEIIKNALTNIDKGSITIISIVFIIWASLALLITIERAFNNIWHVSEGRSLARRIINYWTLLTLGPVLIGVGLYVSTRFGGELKISALSFIWPVISYIVPYLLVFIAFFCLYFLMPNVRVSPKAALWSAALTALVWNIVKWGFSVYVTELIPYQAVYGIMGLIPLAVFWIYLSWLIVLFGLQLTYTMQNLKSIEEAQAEASQGRETSFLANDITAINIMRHISKAFEQEQGPLEMQSLCSELKLSPDFANKLLSHLVDARLLVRTSEPRVGFVPATDAANIKLSDIAKAVAEASFAQEENGVLAEISKKQKELLQQYTVKQLDNH